MGDPSVLGADAFVYDDSGAALGRRRATVSGLLPRHRSRRLIALTPLVDVVFLLLTFFMLSSNLSPFGLLPFGAGPSGSAAGSEAESGSRADLLLSVESGRLRLGGLDIPATDLEGRLRSARAGGATRLAILTSDSATVQDLVFALDAAKAASFASVDLVDFR